jgi:hypothetical protein
MRRNIVADRKQPLGDEQRDLATWQGQLLVRPPAVAVLVVGLHRPAGNVGAC